VTIAHPVIARLLAQQIPNGKRRDQKPQETAPKTLLGILLLYRILPFADTVVSR